MRPLVAVHAVARFATAAVLLSVTLLGQQPPVPGPPPGQGPPAGQGPPPGFPGGPPPGGPGGRRGGFPPFVDPNKKILLIGDRPSHGPGEHEHNAAVWLLQKALTKLPGITATASFNGWPADAQLVDQADAIVMVCDGGARHVAFQEQRADALKRADARGAGLMFMHYCVEPPADRGRAEMLEWIGGYYETNWSVNPMWKPEFATFPAHPITSGVKPFATQDEWYFNLRWADKATATGKVTPLLVAKASDAVRKGPYVNPPGPYDHITAASGRDETMMWAYERPNGGHGVGLTGGHFHQNFADESFRKLVLNAVLWIAKIEVPPQGVTYPISAEEVNERRDAKPARGRGPGPGRGPGRGPMEQ